MIKKRSRRHSATLDWWIKPSENDLIDKNTLNRAQFNNEHFNFSSVFAPITFLFWKKNCISGCLIAGSFAERTIIFFEMWYFFQSVFALRDNLCFQKKRGLNRSVRRKFNNRTYFLNYTRFLRGKIVFLKIFLFFIVKAILP